MLHCLWVSEVNHHMDILGFIVWIKVSMIHFPGWLLLFSLIIHYGWTSVYQLVGGSLGYQSLTHAQRSVDISSDEPWPAGRFSTEMRSLKTFWDVLRCCCFFLYHATTLTSNSWTGWQWCPGGSSWADLTLRLHPPKDSRKNYPKRNCLNRCMMMCII